MNPKVIATTQVTLNGEPWLFFFYSNCAVNKYNLKTGICIACHNMPFCAEPGYSDRGLQASASLVAALKSFDLIK